MNDFINNINLTRKNWAPSEAWELNLLKNQEQDKILHQKYPPSEQDKFYAKQYGKVLINNIDKLDQQSINKSTDAMIAIGTLFTIPTILSPIIGGIGGYLISKSNKKLKNQRKLTSFNGAMIGSGIYFIFREYFRAQLEKMTTRIARFQTRNNELKNSSNFIIHTPEQDLQTKSAYDKTPNNEINIAKNTNILKTYKDAFKTFKEMKKDYKEYTKWKKDFKTKELECLNNINGTNFSNEELSIAQKSRNNIINTLHKLELASNNEEINFQYAIDVVLFITKMFGVALASLLTFAIPKNSSKTIIPKKLENVLKLTVPLSIPIFALFTTPILTKYQKDSAKLGRYEIKKELLNDENNFITYDDNTRKQIDLDIQTPQKLNIFNKVIQDIKSLKTIPKRLNEMYLDLSLTKKDIVNSSTLNISEKQKQDAELLQKQLFYAFEKIDEKSEGFSDDIDALMHILKYTIGTIVNMGLNIYSFNLLANRLKNYNGNKMPEFFEGIKLMKKLSQKDLMAIFILPYAIKSILCIILDTISAQGRKKANKIGIMTAIKDLENEKVFTKEYLENVI